MDRPGTLWVRRPLARLHWETVRIRTPEIPHPDDEPRARVAGPDTARLLLIGDGPALGYGVHSHDLALPGHLARRVAQLTGRGVQLDLIADETLGTTTLSDLYAARARPPYDVIVTLIGSADAPRLTSPRRWCRRFTTLLDRMLRDSPDADAVVLGIPPFHTMPVLEGRAAARADAHARRLNAELEATATSRGVRYVPFDPPAEPDPDRYRSSATYREWAWLIAPAVVEALR